MLPVNSLPMLILLLAARPSIKFAREISTMHYAFDPVDSRKKKVEFAKVPRSSEKIIIILSS